jgi:Ras-related protein Rab-11A
MNSLDDTHSFLLKIILLGDRGVGKSNILLRFTRNDFKISMNSTQGIEFAGQRIYLKDKDKML